MRKPSASDFMTSTKAFRKSCSAIFFMVQTVGRQVRHVDRVGLLMRAIRANGLRGSSRTHIARLTRVHGDVYFRSRSLKKETAAGTSSATHMGRPKAPLVPTRSGGPIGCFSMSVDAQPLRGGDIGSLFGPNSQALLRGIGRRRADGQIPRDRAR